MKIEMGFFAAFSLGLSFGCSHSAKSETKEVSKSELIDSSAVNEHTHSESDSIEFNHGAKWKVVPEMIRHIRTMEAEIQGFSKIKDPALADYLQLASSLQKNSDLLTSNCTMQGKAHDELHKWLLPYLDLVDDFRKSTNIDEAKQTYEELIVSYKTFNLYFE